MSSLSRYKAGVTSGFIVHPYILFTGASSFLSLAVNPFCSSGHR